jgi:Family of unknown function (DUF6165)
MNAAILVSPGELFDKVTILEIKKRMIKDKRKLISINKELDLLNITMDSILKEYRSKRTSLMKQKAALKAANLKLWNIENIIRRMEADKDFGPAFIKKAREVYITNDKRSEIKNRINRLFGSAISEVKQYTKYR